MRLLNYCYLVIITLYFVVCFSEIRAQESVLQGAQKNCCHWRL